MSKAFASIKRGLEQAIAHQEGRPAKLRIHRIPDIDVKAVREKTGLTQLEFAAKFAISPGTLRHWERGDRKPRGTARVLLSIIDREPRTVLRALARNAGDEALGERAARVKAQ